MDAETAPAGTSRNLAGIRTTQDHNSAQSGQEETINIPITPSKRTSDPQAGEEQPLESHEVIELQKFSERKAWIEAKIRLLEKMPPIEVFVGLDALRSASEEVPGLPTRAELQQWLTEHDAIEKETEIFDSGELQKLKKLTKAATQRNLSPEDTDLIELTLTTIYDLDRLLHLLRDRSENLDLLGVRLTWEEQRAAAWLDRHNIITDLQAFLATRARWTPNAYDALSPQTTLSRRPSVASMSSDSSAPPASSALSRSARFKLGELLSRDAAQFIGRVTALRLGKISAAGKALDRLIDNSRVPVPEELLDEQDRLEEKGINDMEGVDKFVMNVVMQWRKSDEIYIETMKDKAAAQTLLEEIETAKLHHPTARQSASFVARADGLVKRLRLRGAPTSPSSSFPHPIHPLFPDQQDANSALAEMLSLEIASTRDLIGTVEDLAREYRGTYEAVRRVEAMCQDADNLSNTFSTIIDRLLNGVTVNNGDGTSPNLTSEACLDQSQHSVYLALLPSIFSELDATYKQADQLLRSSSIALSSLDEAKFDSTFKSRATSDFKRLAALRDDAVKAKREMGARVNRLQDARKVWTLMENMLKELEVIRRLFGEAMDQKRWRQASGRATPPTPESPVVVQFLASAPPDIKGQLDVIQARLSEDITTPLTRLSSSLESPLSQYLLESHKGLTGLLDIARKMSRLLESIQKQADVMSDIRSEAEDFQIRIEDLRMQYNPAIQQVLNSSSLPDASEMRVDLNANAQHIRDAVQAFVNGLSQRIPFVAKGSAGSPSSSGFVKRRFSSQDLRLGVSLQQIPIELPFELSVLDDVVRRDTNSYAMRVLGELQGLQQKEDHLRLAWMAKELDMFLQSTVDSINAAYRQLASQKTHLASLSSRCSSAAALQALSDESDTASREHRTRIARSFSPIRELLHRMDAAPGSHDSAVYEVVYLARSRAVDDAESKFQTWTMDIEAFRNLVSDAQRVEADRLEAERRKRAEEERIAAERITQEEERLAAERIARAEEERLVAERIAREEGNRIATEHLAREGEEEAVEQAKPRRLEDLDGTEGGRLKDGGKLREEEELQGMERPLGETHLQVNDRVALLTPEVILADETASWLDPATVQDDRRLVEAIQHDAVEPVQQDNESGVPPASIQNTAVVEESGQPCNVPGSSHHRRPPTGSLPARVMKTVVKPKVMPNRVEPEKPGTRVRSPEEPRLRAKSKPRHSRGSSSAYVISKSIAAEPEADVFGLRIIPTISAPVKTNEITGLLAQISYFKKRLRSMNLDEVSHPTTLSSTLPTEEQAAKIEADLIALAEDINHLPISAEDSSVDLELSTIRAEVEASAQMIPRILDLAKLSSAIRNCDNALSDLLEHIDSFPALPMDIASAHTSQLDLSPNDQLSSRIAFTRSVVEEMTACHRRVADDNRAEAERKRILQTWSELEDMGKDVIEGKKSRPTSVISSGKSSSSRNIKTDGISASHTKKDSYSNLSRKPSNHGRYLTPTQPKAPLRRAISGSSDVQSRTSSRMSVISSQRSISGPTDLTHSSLFKSTFASRQRTTSLSLSASAAQGPAHRPSTISSGPRAGTSLGRRPQSPTFSDGHVYSRSLATPSRSSTSTSTSTWARAPRPSNPLLPKILSPPQTGASEKKRTYIANPKNKLDIAVGEVVNQLPIDINVEVVEDTWKDQSGKYWIGDQEPKLCFCRILRSQTVMVRVGGGWTELSKFIKDHFADALRFLPDSPPHSRPREEKWINSATLLEAPETPPLSPTTPEPMMPFVPTLSLLTPTGHSPRSLKSTPSTGSPLMPMQFMRRADAENSYLRPSTPSKPPAHRLQKSAPATPARHVIWRP